MILQDASAQITYILVPFWGVILKLPEVWLHQKPSYKRAYKRKDPYAIAKIKLRQCGEAFKPHTPSLCFLWGTCLCGGYQTNLRRKCLNWRDLIPQFGPSGQVVLAFVQLSTSAKANKNEATDEHTSSSLGAPSSRLQRSCTSPPARGAARVPPQAMPPYSCSHEHTHQTRGHSWHPNNRDHDIRQRIDMGTQSRGKHYFFFISGFKMAIVTSSLRIHLCIFCPTHINLWLSLIFYELYLIPLHYKPEREEKAAATNAIDGGFYSL